MADTHQADDSFHEIIYVLEAAGLRAVTVDGERPPAQRLHDEPSACTTKFVTMRPSGIHARAVGVENSDNTDWDASLSRVARGHRFGVPLRLVIHTARSNRVHVAPVVLPAAGAPKDRRTPRSYSPA